MDDFYAARSRPIPPLPWPTIAPPLTFFPCRRAAIPRRTRKFLLCCPAPARVVRQRSPPDCRSPSRPQGRGPETTKRRKNSATIGTFKKNGTEYTGEILALSLQAKGMRLGLSSLGENAPSHRVLVGHAEIGAAWTKKSNEAVTTCA